MAQRTLPKIVTDLFIQQLKWSLWFLSTVLVIQLAVFWFVAEPGVRELSFLTFAFQPSKIYMLVIGTLSAFYYLSFFVKQGITRKDYFLGTALSAAGLAFTIIVITALVSGVLFFIGTFTDFLADMSTVTFLNTQSEWVLPIIVFSIIIFAYYLAGWMISVGFYRFGGLGGLAIIVLAIVFISAIDLLWEFELTHPVGVWLNLNLNEFPLSVSLIGTGILLAACLWIIRSITKKMTIKIE